MESLSEKSNKNFFKYVFNFDEDSKGELLNIVQYSILALIPMVVLNKSIQRFIPEADDEKGSLEIIAEIIIQIIIMFFGLFFIDRIVMYVPTYSGYEYPPHFIYFNILTTLMITLSLQTKMGEKASILIERITELWDGKMNSNSNNNKNSKKSNKNNNNVKVSQPVSQNLLPPSIPIQKPNSSYSDGTSINQLPNNYSTSTQPSPDFNNMYQRDNTPLVDASGPGSGYENVIMAANEALGGSGFSTW
jgi:hypothetical protein